MSANARCAGGRIAQRRGECWESVIHAANTGYERLGLASVHKIPTPSRYTRAGLVLQRGFTCDYEGYVKHCGVLIPVRFEAKSFGGGRWDISVWKPRELVRSVSGRRTNRRHQWLAMQRCSRDGGLAFVLVRRSEPVQEWLVPFPLLDVAAGGSWSLSVEWLEKNGIAMRGADWVDALLRSGLLGRAVENVRGLLTNGVGNGSMKSKGEKQ